MSHRQPELHSLLSSASGWACFTAVQLRLHAPTLSILPIFPQVRSQALLFIKRMYEKEQLREYVEKFALNYLQLLVHPNPPSVLFGADKDTGLMQLHLICVEFHPAY